MSTAKVHKFFLGRLVSSNWWDKSLQAVSWNSFLKHLNTQKFCLHDETFLETFGPKHHLKIYGYIVGCHLVFLWSARKPHLPKLEHVLIQWDKHVCWDKSQVFGCSYDENLANIVYWDCIIGQSLTVTCKHGLRAHSHKVFTFATAIASASKWVPLISMELFTLKQWQTSKETIVDALCEWTLTWCNINLNTNNLGYMYETLANLCQLLFKIPW